MCPNRQAQAGTAPPPTAGGAAARGCAAGWLCTVFDDLWPTTLRIPWVTPRQKITGNQISYGRAPAAARRQGPGATAAPPTALPFAQRIQAEAGRSPGAAGGPRGAGLAWARAPPAPAGGGGRRCARLAAGSPPCSSLLGVTPGWPGAAMGPPTQRAWPAWWKGEEHRRSGPAAADSLSARFTSRSTPRTPDMLILA